MRSSRAGEGPGTGQAVDASLTQGSTAQDENAGGRARSRTGGAPCTHRGTGGTAGLTAAPANAVSKASGTPPRVTPASIHACAEELARHLALGRPVALSCDSTPESVLAGIGITYLAHAREGEVRLASSRGVQARLGEVVLAVPPGTSEETALFGRRVLVGFSNKVGSPHIDDVDEAWAQLPGWGNACTRRLAYATASDDPAMPEVVHRYLRLGFSAGPRIWRMIADPRVAAFDGLARHVLNECEHARQFVRFSHLADWSFVASFAPKDNVIPLVASHFSARMGTERFCLVDPVHRVAAFHEPSHKGCQVVLLDAALARDLARRSDLADDEAYVRAMWQRFYRGTTTPGRGREQRGYDLRTSWMPQRFWSGLSELDETTDRESLRAPARYAGTERNGIRG